jgi:hypothetical protein
VLRSLNSGFICVFLKSLYHTKEKRKEQTLRVQTQKTSLMLKVEQRDFCRQNLSAPQVYCLPHRRRRIAVRRLAHRNLAPHTPNIRVSVRSVPFSGVRAISLRRGIRRLVNSVLCHLRQWYTCAFRPAEETRHQRTIPLHQEPHVPRRRPHNRGASNPPRVTLRLPDGNGRVDFIPPTVGLL